MRVDMYLAAGIVFDSSILREPWAVTLAAFVAFNTLLYVGLSFGKILYWPKPLLPRVFDEMRQATTHEELPTQH